jgi:hypothetical protein
LTEAEAAVPPGTPPPVDQFVPEEPPRITFDAVDPAVRMEPGIPWVTRVPKVRLRLRILALGAAKLGDRSVVFDEQLFKAALPIGPGPEYQEELELELPPNRPVGLLVTATNDKARPRAESIEMVYQPPAPPVPVPAPPPPTMPNHLIVLSLGTDAFPVAALPAVPFADRDAGQLAEFLSSHMVTALGTRPGLDPPTQQVVLTGARAATAGVRAGLDQLNNLLENKQLVQGDVVAVVVSSHVLEFKDANPLSIAVFDTKLDKPGQTMIAAQELSALFGRLTDYGCRVALFLDGVHEGKLPEKVRSVIKPWVRDLQQNRRVIIFVASKEGPSGRPSAAQQNGLFALGVLNSLQRSNRGAAFTLEQFRTTVIDEVLNLSNREQQVGCYVPRGMEDLLRKPFIK